MNETHILQRAREAIQRGSIAEARKMLDQVLRASPRSETAWLWLSALVNTPRPVCDCSGDHYNCTDFASTGAARACYRYCTGLGKGDVHRLDSDDDGIACESLP